ncbi:hypothetical protein SELMODRAFT_404082 [Selaginella moellendorffii]|uniref:Uncharacterized protein n=2 Tax=Selaginella moellendorffii TaxID=88036 RepID=D8QU81_SELML|nr:hypothetical protein SELMODRAFT_404082 [Selaginella moellendorffii]
MRYIPHDLGYEAPYRPGKAVSFPDAKGRVSSLDDGLVARTPTLWRPGIKRVDPGSGSLSERPFKPSLRMVPGPEDNKLALWKSSIHSVDHVDESLGDSKWKSSRHRPSIFSEWYLEETANPEWRSTRKPGTYLHQPEWIPPFREYEGKVPRRFYSIVPGEAARAAAAAGAAAGAAGATSRGGPVGKRKSKVYNQFATTLHYDENKRFVGGIKIVPRPKSDTLGPFASEQTPRTKRQFTSHICHTDGVSILMNHNQDKDYNSYIFH